MKVSHIVKNMYKGVVEADATKAEVQIEWQVARDIKASCLLKCVSSSKTGKCLTWFSGEHMYLQKAQNIWSA